MKKPAIPSVSSVADQRIASLLRPMKENLEILTGQRGGSLTKLDGSATLSEVISKLNQVIDRLNA
jgi:hypothetical protein